MQVAVPRPAQAAGTSVSFRANALGTGAFFVDLSNPADPVFVGASRTANTGYMLVYGIADVVGTVNDSGFGSTPASSVNVSGGSINPGKVVFTLNVNTCDVAGFTTSSGPCGAFDITWTEEPATVAGSVAIRQNIIQTLPDGGKEVSNGATVSHGALWTGTALNYSPPGPAFGFLTQGTSVFVTVSAP